MKYGKMRHDLLQQLDTKSIHFADVLKYIEDHYQHSPTSFANGAQINAQSENQGSAKVLFFAQLNNFNEQDTLLLFAEYYDAVLANPEGSDHQNIRQFMQNGWDKVVFDGQALHVK